jgi:hypothetical protein
VLIDLDKGATPQSAVAELLKQQKQFDQGPTKVAPSMQVRHAKLFMDGVIRHRRSRARCSIRIWSTRARRSSRTGSRARTTARPATSRRKRCAPR